MMRGGYGRLGGGVLRTLTGQRERNNGAWRRLISVYVGGQGMVPITRNQGASLKEMGATAINAAIQDAGVDPKNVGALYVGNMMSGMLSDQQHMGPYLATAAGLAGIEATTIEACCGCGGAAMRMGYMAVASGMHETVVVAGVEQMTHQDRDMVTRGLATASNWETEGAKGKTFVTLNGDLMSLYMAKYGVAAEKFAPFPINAHRNAGTSEHATLRKPVTEEGYAESRVLTDPIRIMDASPTCDGAAAVVLTSSRAIAQRPGAVFVRIAGSGAASDVLPVHERPDPLHLRAVEQSLSEALRRARLTHGDVDLFELHDAYSIMACLCLESAGFVQAGEGTAFAQDGNLGLRGVLPIATFGGLKARGHPVGATGVYQAAEMLLQLNGRAGENQVRGAQVGVVQNIGGAGGSVYTHVMVREG